MRFISCTALSLLAGTLTTTTAEAGGLGLDLIGGTQGEQVIFFDANSQKFKEMQQRPTFGVGIQAILGDRDDALIGIMKFSYINDAPAHSAVTIPEDFTGDSPTQITARLPCDDANAQTPCGSSPGGTISAGLQWRLWGDPMGFQLSLLPSVGAGILTQDSTEYVQVQLGPGWHYAISKELQINGEIVYQARYRKGLTHGASLSTGIRWLFD